MAPVAQELGKVLKKILRIPVTVTVAKDYASAVENIRSRRVDFAYLHPVSYVHASKDGKARMLVKIKRHGSSSFTSRFFVLKAGGIKALGDLKGRKIAFVDRLSTSGYIYPMTLLLREKLIAGGNPQSFFSEVRFAGSHDAALRALLRGEVDTAVSFNMAPARFLDKEADRVTYVAESVPIIEGGICAHADVPPELAEKVRAALLSINTRAYPKLIKHLFLLDADGFSPVEDSEYAGIREAMSLLAIP